MISGDFLFLPRIVSLSLESLSKAKHVSQQDESELMEFRRAIEEGVTKWNCMSVGSFCSTVVIFPELGSTAVLKKTISRIRRWRLLRCTVGLEIDADVCNRDVACAGGVVVETQAAELVGVRGWGPCAKAGLRGLLQSQFTLPSWKGEEGDGGEGEGEREGESEGDGESEPEEQEGDESSRWRLPKLEEGERRRAERDMWKRDECETERKVRFLYG